MTAQSSDSCLRDGEEYSLIGLEGEGLTTPQDLGMTPAGLGSWCYRGFHATYEIVGEQLHLKRLAVRNADGKYPPINGATATPQQGVMVYEDINLPVPFTGRVRLAKDFILALYVHMGFQKASAFETVHDLTFEEGRLTGLKDRSEEMAEKRGAFRRCPVLE